MPVQWAGRLFVALLLPALGAQPADAAVSGLVRLFAITSGGYDDDILGRSAASSSRPDVTVAAGFGQVSPVADFRIGRGAWEATGSYAFLYNRFFKPEAGGYRDHDGELELRVKPTAWLLLAAGGNLESFRRSRFNEYDLDHAEATLRAEAIPDPRVTLRGALSLQRDHYPRSRVERLVRPPALFDTVDQRDTPTNFEISATLRPVTRVTLEAGWVLLRTDSNVARFGYDGQQAFIGASGNTGRGGTVAISWIHETRDYDTLGPVPARLDHSNTWQVELRQRVAEPVTAFCAGSRLDYHSNQAGYSFDQSRVRAGLEIRLARLRAGARELDGSDTRLSFLEAARIAGAAASGEPDSASGPADLSPRVMADGVRFRCRAPGATRVVLVGSFNGWNRAATPLTGPDRAGLWEVRLPLPPGTYRYMFHADGAKWIKPEGAPLYEDDGFGLTNGVLVVP